MTKPFSVRCHALLKYGLLQSSRKVAEIVDCSKSIICEWVKAAKLLHPGQPNQGSTASRSIRGGPVVWGDAGNLLVETDPVYNVGAERLAACKEFFAALPDSVKMDALLRYSKKS